MSVHGRSSSDRSICLSASRNSTTSPPASLCSIVPGDASSTFTAARDYRVVVRDQRSCRSPVADAT